MIAQTPGIQFICRALARGYLVIIKGLLSGTFLNLVEWLINRNTIYPAEEFILLIEIRYMFKNFEKNCLCDIRCILSIPQYSICCVINRSFVLANQQRHRLPVTLFTPVYQGSITVLTHKNIRGPKKLVKIWCLFSCTVKKAHLVTRRYNFE